MKVNEIFYSIQGESSLAGLPCVFVRLSGCNLRCRYCDTTYAYDQGIDLSMDEIVQRVSPFDCELIEITGGEPLLQPETPQLALLFANHKKHVLVETNGSMDIDLLPPPIVRIMDIKCPGSGETGRMNWENIKKLRRSDEIKFVISDREDFDWAVSVMKQYQLAEHATILFSAVYRTLDPGVLASWILESKITVRLQIQLHKFLSLK